LNTQIAAQTVGIIPGIDELLSAKQIIRVKVSFKVDV